MTHRTRWIERLLLAAALACSFHATATEPGEGLDARHRFAIPQQPLAGALLAFSSQANIQVMSSSADLDHRVSAAVSGELTIRDALARLLQGTGMRFHAVSDDAVSIEPIARPAEGEGGKTSPARQDE